MLGWIALILIVWLVAPCGRWLGRAWRPRAPLALASAPQSRNAPPVIPGKAGIHAACAEVEERRKKVRIAAFAGMTGKLAKALAADIRAAAAHLSERGRIGPGCINLPILSL